MLSTRFSNSSNLRKSAESSGRSTSHFVQRGFEGVSSRIQLISPSTAVPSSAEISLDALSDGSALRGVLIGSMWVNFC